MENKTCFDILGVPRDASLKDVKQSYKRLVKRWHPDQYANDPEKQQAAHERLTEINVAYRESVAILKSAPATAAFGTDTEKTAERQATTDRAQAKKDSIFRRMSAVFNLRSRGAEDPRSQTPAGSRPPPPQDFNGGRAFDSEFQRAVRRQPRRSEPEREGKGPRKRSGGGKGPGTTTQRFTPPLRSQGDRVEKIRPVRRVGKI